MKQMTHPAASGTAAAAALLILSASAVQALEVGDSAPALSVDEWLQGEPVQLAGDAQDRIYVVEFWATWCFPCVESIPHLNALQQQYQDKNVKIIGVTDEEPAFVRQFLAENELAYRVARDNNKETWDAYARAFGVEQIPHAFVISEGRIMWHGHPLQGLDETLEQLVNNSYNLEETRATLAAAQEAEEFQQLLPLWAETYVTLARYGRDTERADRLAAEIEAHGHHDVLLLNLLAWQIAVTEELKHRDLDFALRLSGKAKELSEGKDADILDTHARVLYELGHVDEAIAQQREAIAVCDDPRLREVLREHLAQMGAEEEELVADAVPERNVEDLAQIYIRLAVSGADNAQAQRVGAKILNHEAPEVQTLNGLSWFILTETPLAFEDYGFALQLAEKARELTNAEDADILDTYALALFMNQDIEGAIEEQERGLEICSEPALRGAMEQRLRLYRQFQERDEERHAPTQVVVDQLRTLNA